MICMPKDKAEGFCREIEETEGYPAWIIGDVEPGKCDEGNAHVTAGPDSLTDKN